MDAIRKTPVSSILNFVSLLGKLKHTKRAGWVQRGVRDCESVADHMYRMAVMSMMLPNTSELDRDRCIRISLVHDIAECIVGDITPSDNVPKAEKHAKELDAIKHMKKLVPEDFGEELLKLWQEYESQSTPESQFVKDLDKFDMVMQAHEYEVNRNTPGKLQEFFDSTAGQFKHPEVKQWVSEIMQERNTTKNSDG